MVRPNAGAAATPSAAKGFGSAEGARSITSSFSGVLVLVVVWLGVLFCSRSRKVGIQIVLLPLLSIPQVGVLLVGLIL